MKQFRIGYLPLTDAAMLIIAAAKGFDRAEGIRIELVRETSWASLRDNLVVGNLDAAHCLAPLAAATHLGIGHVAFPLTVERVLTLNGNAVTVSAELAMELGDPLAPLLQRAEALVRLARERQRRGRPLVLATVFRFSCHTLILDRLFEIGGGDLKTDADLVVLPPSLMVEGLAKGVIDGFAVGSPWNSAAVEHADGSIIAIGHEILPDFVEKLLVAPANLPSGARVAMPALMAALARAVEWLGNPDHREETVAILASVAHLDCDPALISRSLSGDLRVNKTSMLHEPDYLRFVGGSDAETLASSARRLIGQMQGAGMLEATGPELNALDALFHPVVLP